MMTSSSAGKNKLKRRREYFEYLFFLFQKWIISLIPFRLLYFYSDLAAFFLHHIVHYRLGIVKKNLERSFPSVPPQELKRITREFYRNLADVTIESIKGYSADLSELQKRYTFSNIEVANKYARKNQDVILALSHYGNWEWGSQVAGLVFSHQLYALYKPMANQYVDNYISQHRTREGMKLIRTDKPWIMSHTRNSHPSAYFFISDQNPGNGGKVIRKSFLNQETAWSRGIEVYSRQFNMPVIYVSVQRVKRGFYNIMLQEIVSDPSRTKPGEITGKYMECLERQIQNKPEDWLWSHRRWKNSVLP